MQEFFSLVLIGIVIFGIGQAIYEAAQAAGKAAEAAADATGKVIQKGVDIATSEEGKAFLEGVAKGYIEDKRRQG